MAPKKQQSKSQKQPSKKRAPVHIDPAQLSAQNVQVGLPGLPKKTPAAAAAAAAAAPTERNEIAWDDLHDSIAELSKQFIRNTEKTDTNYKKFKNNIEYLKNYSKKGKGTEKTATIKMKEILEVLNILDDDDASSVFVRSDSTHNNIDADIDGMFGDTPAPLPDDDDDDDDGDKEKKGSTEQDEASKATEPHRGPATGAETAAETAAEKAARKAAEKAAKKAAEEEAAAKEEAYEMFMDRIYPEVDKIDERYLKGKTEHPEPKAPPKVDKLAEAKKAIINQFAKKSTNTRTKYVHVSPDEKYKQYLAKYKKI